MTWRFTKPLLRKHAPHFGQWGHDVGDSARIWYTVGSPVTGLLLKFAHAVPLVAM